MSGIFGCIHLTSQPSITSPHITSLRKWNLAYGPDGNSISEGKNFVMGCCYENISNSPAPTNFILETSNYYATIDTILYNRDELLPICALPPSVSDEELLLYYIEQFGLDSLKKINGDFCGALINKHTNTVTLFRDHMGIRPLFYCIHDNTLVFSTDIRGIVSIPELNITINEEWIYKTISGYSTLSAESTEYSNIFCVLPGSYIDFDTNQQEYTSSKHIYWSLGKNKIHFSSIDLYKKKLNELITDSIRRRLNATSCQIGAELSGGVDSGVIDIIINRLGRSCTFFSWSPSPTQIPYVENDERLVISDICTQEKISCNFLDSKIVLDTNSTIDNTMRKLNFHIDYQKADIYRYVLPAYTNTLTISKTSEFINRSNGKIVFTGHGGDEGVSHRCTPYELLYHHEYYHYLKQMWLLSENTKCRLAHTIKNICSNLKHALLNYSKPYVSPIATPQLLSTNFQKEHHSSPPKVYFSYDTRLHILNGGSRNRLDNLALQGAFSGVRYFIPYLDYRVIDFATSIPRHLFLHGKTNRYIFREAFKDIMPPSLYTQRYKRDFSRSSAQTNSTWNEIYIPQKKEIADILTHEKWSKYLNFELIEEWLNRNESTPETQDQDENIFICLSLCAMAQNVLDKTREIYEQNTKKEHENADS